VIRSRSTVYLLAVALPATAAAVLVALRGQVDAANLALILAACVVSAAVVGGRGPGVVASVVGAGAFDLFLTQPYGSFAIEKSEDALTAALLLALGLTVGELAGWAARQSGRADRRADDVGRMFYAAEQLAGAQAHTVPATVTGELRDLLQLADCRYDALPPDPSRACLEEDGRVVWGALEWPVGSRGFPVAGVDLPVRFQGRLVGTFHLDPGSPVPIEGSRLLVAVALADLAGTVLAAEWSAEGAAG